MIVPMKKVSLVVLANERKTALEKLKKLGIVHLEQVEGKGEQLASYKEAYNASMTAVSILSELKGAKKATAPSSVSDEQVLKASEEVLSISEQKKKLLEQIATDNAELERLSAWGGVNPEDFAFLKEKGISLKLYEIPEDKYALIDDTVKTICVNHQKKIIRFVLVDAAEERPESFPPEAYEVPMPLVSTTAISKRIAEDTKTVSELDKKLLSFAGYVPLMNRFRKVLDSNIEFETFYSGMGQENEGKTTDLAWLTGFVPVDTVDSLSACAKENAWAVSYSEPSEEDAVPTKLKNNKLVSLIYPLTDFLGTVPGYHEYDISGWFLLFFTVFFGMIFGDGGYGLLVTVVAALLLAKGAIKKQKASPMLSLVLLLGIATVAWGFVTCTWFGLTPQQLRAFGFGFLPDYSVKVLSNAYSTLPDGTDKMWLLPWSKDGSGLTTAQNLQIFCFTLALLQLSVAHFKGMARYCKSLKFLGELGSLLQIWGMYYVVLMMVVSGEVFSIDAIIIKGTLPFAGTEFALPIGYIFVALVAVGFALSFVFSNYDGSVGKSILESCKNIISVLLGVVNVFSDIVSYIRLWAVGLAGAAISDTVNTMAGPLLGHAILFVAAVLLLVFGHGLNMVLNLLSVIVHGVRLNTLEFSNHLGMSWSGFKYSPFVEKDII